VERWNRWTRMPSMAPENAGVDVLRFVRRVCAHRQRLSCSRRLRAEGYGCPLRPYTNALDAGPRLPFCSAFGCGCANEIPMRWCGTVLAADSFRPGRSLSHACAGSLFPFPPSLFLFQKRWAIGRWIWTLEMGQREAAPRRQLGKGQG
jgi:hypothetical protein